MPDRGSITAAFESGAGEWVQILFLVFGGCCSQVASLLGAYEASSNVWALEAMLKNHPKAGTFLTFAQILYVTLQNISSNVEFRTSKADAKGSRGTRQRSWLPRLKTRKVPFKRWVVQVVLFLAINLMNNQALGMKIPMTIHIIFRSGGLCVSMLVGYFAAGRRYTTGQVVSGIMITTGIVIATISAPRRRPSQPGTGEISTQSDTTPPHAMSSDTVQYMFGITLLAIALVISALLGLWQEQTYARYGKQWREGLFYSHFLSLPFFIPMYSSISRTFLSFASSPPMLLFTLPIALPDPTSNYLTASSPSRGGGKSIQEIVIPSAFFALAMNVITQGICIRGVNRLTARVNSTTVNLVLTLRKAVSLAISVWYYGSGLTTGLAIGGVLVLVGTVIYSFTTPKIVKTKPEPGPVIEAVDDLSTSQSSHGTKASALQQNGDELRKRT